jgi:hypothetical protein
MEEQRREHECRPKVDYERSYQAVGTSVLPYIIVTALTCRIPSTIRPSSNLHIGVFRKSRIIGRKPHNVGCVSDNAIRMVGNRRVFQSTLYMSIFPLILTIDTLILLYTHAKSTVSMGVCLTLDDSGTPSISDLGLASTALDRAHASFERTDGSQVKTTSEIVGDALRYLDVVVKFVDSISRVIPFNTMTTVMSSCIRL